MRYIFLVFSLFFATITLAAQDAPKILVDIPPTAALVQKALDENAEITILLSSAHSGHHFTLTTEQVSQIEKADFVFGVGTIFIPEMVKAARNVNQEGLVKFYYDDGDPKDLYEDDPHIWLSQSQLSQMLKFYKSILSQNDIAVSQFEWQEYPRPNVENRVPLIASHEAFGYFERENNIQSFGAFHDGHDQPLPPRAFGKVINAIDSQQISCLLMSTGEHEKDLLELAEEKFLKVEEFDLLGWQFLPDEDFFLAYFTELNSKYESCD